MLNADSCHEDLAFGLFFWLVCFPIQCCLIFGTSTILPYPVSNSGRLEEIEKKRRKSSKSCHEIVIFRFSVLHVLMNQRLTSNYARTSMKRNLGLLRKRLWFQVMITVILSPLFKHCRKNMKHLKVTSMCINKGSAISAQFAIS